MGKNEGVYLLFFYMARVIVRDKEKEFRPFILTSDSKQEINKLLKEWQKYWSKLVWKLEELGYAWKKERNARRNKAKELKKSRGFL